MRRTLIVFAVIIGILGITAGPAAAAWGPTVGQGSPGYVRNVSRVGAEGGICGDPAQSISCSSVYDQVFINKYQANTAPYNVTQTVSSTGYLYYYNGSSWVQYLTVNEGSCRGIAGNGSGGCTFGSNASDVGSCPCTPAFYNLPQGYSWTIVVRVTWNQYSNGALLSYADYYPTSSSSDIGCASYAVGQRRCSGPYAGARVNLRAPSANIGYISMPRV